MGIYSHLVWAFLKIGALGFGGGLAIVSLIRDSITRFTDMSAETFANIVAIAQVTPGPVAINTATYVGYKTAGFLGSAAATFSVAIPSFIMITIIASMTERYKNSRAVKGAFAGVRPVTVGMIGSALITLTIPAITSADRLGASFIPESLECLPVDPVACLICIATAVLVGKYKKSPFVILIIMGAIGAVFGV